MTIDRPWLRDPPLLPETDVRDDAPATDGVRLCAGCEADPMRLCAEHAALIVELL